MKGTRLGFTIIEIIVVFGILATLLGIGYISVVNIQRRAPLSATASVLVGDLRGQQTKAMTGDTQTGATSDSYGIYFQSNAYILFKGLSYNPSDTTNAVTPLPTNITVSTVFPGSSIVFAKGSGDIVGFAQGSSWVTLTENLNGEHKTLTVNRYGAVTSIQ
jgi:type II secretory pathway pseudopilin PulG